MIWQWRRGKVCSTSSPFPRNFTRTRDVFTGPRNISTVDFTDRRDLSFDPFLFFRIRHTFS